MCMLYVGIEFLKINKNFSIKQLLCLIEEFFTKNS